jgi:hypothetical protein
MPKWEVIFARSLTQKNPSVHRLTDFLEMTPAKSTRKMAPSPP